MAMRLGRFPVVVALLALTSGCGSCGKRVPPEPAPRRELELVEKALGPGGYQEAMAELEKNPKAALRAVREQSAPPRSRKAVYLTMMADHLGHVEDYRRWSQKLTKSAPAGAATPIGPRYPQHISGLDGKAQVHFWAERLLTMGGAEQMAAIAHLERIGGDAAADALAVAIRPEVGANFQGRAGLALARMGRGRDLAEGFAGSADQYDITSMQMALRALSPAARAATEKQLLAALEKEPLTREQRTGYLRALGEIGSDATADRLAELRRSDWGKEMSAEIDTAIAAILDRQDDAAPAPKGGKQR